MFAHTLWTPFLVHTPLFGTVYIAIPFHNNIATFCNPSCKDINGKHRMYFDGRSYAIN